MRRQVTAAMCVLIVAIAATPVSSYGHTAKHSRRPPTCRLGGSHGRHWKRMLADSQAEIYEAPEKNGVVFVYGCVYGGRRYVLGIAPTGGHEEGLARARHIVLVGSMVAYVRTEVGPAETGGGEEETVYVVVGNLKSLRVVHMVPSGIPQGPVGKNDVGAGPVRSIVLKADGAVAWITEEGYTGHISYQVRALDQNGERLLASGEDIASGSLALAGSTVYWTQEGNPFSAPLD